MCERMLCSRIMPGSCTCNQGFIIHCGRFINGVIRRTVYHGIHVGLEIWVIVITLQQVCQFWKLKTYHFLKIKGGCLEGARSFFLSIKSFFASNVIWYGVRFLLLLLLLPWTVIDRSASQVFYSPASFKYSRIIRNYLFERCVFQAQMILRGENLIYPTTLW